MTKGRNVRAERAEQMWTLSNSRRREIKEERRGASGRMMAREEPKIEVTASLIRFSMKGDVPSSPEELQTEGAHTGSNHPTSETDLIWL